MFYFIIARYRFRQTRVVYLLSFDICTLVCEVDMGRFVIQISAIFIDAQC